MGPCPFRHGYAAEGAVRIVRADGFNGGHALSGMDTVFHRV